MIMENKILEKLITWAANRDNPRIITKGDYDSLLTSIRENLSNGWLPNEIYNFLKLSEEVNPFIEEDTALRRMAVIARAVERRLGSTSLGEGK